MPKTSAVAAATRKATSRIGPSVKEDVKAGILATVMAWQDAKWGSEREKKRATKLNSEIKSALDLVGEPDENGNVWYTLPTPVDGWDTKGTPTKITQLKKERRVSLSVDTDAAKDLLESKGPGVYESCADFWVNVKDPAAVVQLLLKHGLLDPGEIHMTSALDTDRLAAQVFEGTITQAEYDALFTESVSFALTTPK